MGRERLDYNPLEYPYASRRAVLYAENGMVAASQPLAAQSGLEIIKKGGNAIDAAVATAASLTVLEPTSNGIGGDAFSLVWSEGNLYGLNASGPSPGRISVEKLSADGYESMPKFGWEPVTVPGAPAGWAELSRRFGDLSLEEALRPAIKYAEGGYPVSPTVGKLWKEYYERYKNLNGPEFEHWFNTFAPKGRPPTIGEVWNSPVHAETLRKIARSESDSFYRGEIAKKIGEFSRRYGGYLSENDLKRFSPDWVDPISAKYRKHEIWEVPPNGQGLIALLTLRILNGFEFGSMEKTKIYHKQIEALKISFAHVGEAITDPDCMEIDISKILSEEFVEDRRREIGKKALDVDGSGIPSTGDTVYLATADGQGNMVSHIQSNFMGFGSGLVVPDTGIALQNRGSLFSLDPCHANALEPNKKTYHTIIPGFLTRDGDPIGPFGIMGGFMQPQGHVQIISDSLDFDQNPQAALDAPRWRWIGDKKVKLERRFPPHIAKSLSIRGHNVDYSFHSEGFGRGQIIWNENDVLVGGTEPRCDGGIACW